jgi:hypothetical protein
MAERKRAFRTRSPLRGLRRDEGQLTTLVPQVQFGQETAHVGFELPRSDGARAWSTVTWRCQGRSHVNTKQSAPLPLPRVERWKNGDAWDTCLPLEEIEDQARASRPLG